MANGSENFKIININICKVHKLAECVLVQCSQDHLISKTSLLQVTVTSFELQHILRLRRSRA